MNKRTISLIFFLTLSAALLLGCESLARTLKKEEVPKEEPKRRATFLKAYQDLKKEIQKKSTDALLVGVSMPKPPDEPWDGKSSIWRAAFYSQKDKKVYLMTWTNGSAKIDKEENPEKGIENRVISNPVAVDSVDALEIANATLVTQVNPQLNSRFTKIVLAYSNSHKRHVWKVDFENNHYVYVDAVTGEAIEAK